MRFDFSENANPRATTIYFLAPHFAVGILGLAREIEDSWLLCICVTETQASNYYGQCF